MSKKTLPVVVQNLRAIWSKKKVEMQFTQVGAAKKLGWSQGAISHYLNNLTELGPAAVIKFANFLGVDPVEIDPSITGFLPNIRTRVIKYDWSNLTSPMNEKFYDKNPESAFWVRVDGEIWTDLTEDQKRAIGGAPWHIRVCPVKDFPNARLFLVQLKRLNQAKLYRAEALPEVSRINAKYSILELDINLQPDYHPLGK
jgi:transcriptional regulator with XRE-family HTH domain|tara:strand:- start:320 stop:916 length:597 start_codon:yes stop_codon:yes gene_type:complete